MPVVSLIPSQAHESLERTGFRFPHHSIMSGTVQLGMLRVMRRDPSDATQSVSEHQCTISFFCITFVKRSITVLISTSRKRNNIELTKVCIELTKVCSEFIGVQITKKQLIITHQDVPPFITEMSDKYIYMKKF